MMIKWNMPYLAADGGGAGGAGEPETAAAEEQAQDFDSLLENEEYKTAYEQRIKAAVEESTKQAKAEWEAAAKQAEEQRKVDALPEEQKAEALLKAEKERADRLEREKNEILLKQMATSLLAEKKLPVEATDFLIGADEDATRKNVETFGAAFDAAVAAAVKEKVPGYTPKASGDDAKKGAGGFLDAIREKQAKRR